MGVNYSHYIVPIDCMFRPEPEKIVALVEAWMAAGFIVRTGVSRKDSALLSDVMQPTGAAFWLDDNMGQFEEPQKPGFIVQLLQRCGLAVPARLNWIEQRRPFEFPPVGESLAALSQANVSIEWDIHYPEAGATYPFQIRPSAEQYECALIIDLSEDMTFHANDMHTNQEIPDFKCSCGEAMMVKNVESDGKKIRHVCQNCGQLFKPKNVSDGRISKFVNSDEEHVIPFAYRFAIILNCGRFPPIEDFTVEEILAGAKSSPKSLKSFMEICRSVIGIEFLEISVSE